MREREARAFAEVLERSCSGPLVVAGDFNDFDLVLDEKPVIRSTVLSSLRACCGGLSSAAAAQSARSSTVYGVLIDHILTSRHWSVAECTIHKSQDAQEQPVKDRTSDHYPVSAKLTLSNK